MRSATTIGTANSGRVRIANGSSSADMRLHAVRRVVRQQSLGRRILRVDGIRIALDRRGDLHRELLAELHAPLVEGVDAPDRALRERDVLVERDQLTEYL